VDLSDSNALSQLLYADDDHSDELAARVKDLPEHTPAEEAEAELDAKVEAVAEAEAVVDAKVEAVAEVETEVDAEVDAEVEVEVEAEATPVATEE
jgi:pilus assembly protein FimV